MDAEGGGRLIYYDFGMMGVIPSDIRSGLLELFYGVYEKDSDRWVALYCNYHMLVQFLGCYLACMRRTATVPHALLQPARSC